MQSRMCKAKSTRDNNDPDSMIRNCTRPASGSVIAIFFLGYFCPGLFFPGMDVARADERCHACHRVVTPDAVNTIAGSVHAQEADCTGCHGASLAHLASPQKAPPDIVEDRSGGVCLACHAAVRQKMNLPSTHPVAEGVTTCTDCHDPHGSMTGGDLRGMTLNDSCFACHESLRGPFLFEHEPVSEDCSLCHEPHGSVHSPLLHTRAPLLCQQCHMAAFHPSVPAGGSGLPSGMPSAALLGRNCLNCHSRVHGSNHPGGARLTQ